MSEPIDHPAGSLQRRSLLKGTAGILATGVFPAIHAADPITWLGPELIWQRPEWLTGERAPDVSPHMRWIPVVTAVQVGLDMLVSVDVPAMPWMCRCPAPWPFALLSRWIVLSPQGRWPCAP